MNIISTDAIKQPDAKPLGMLSRKNEDDTITISDVAYISVEENPENWEKYIKDKSTKSKITEILSGKGSVTLKNSYSGHTYTLRGLIK